MVNPKVSHNEDYKNIVVKILSPGFLTRSYPNVPVKLQRLA